jgi:hypothetical protein
VGAEWGELLIPPNPSPTWKEFIPAVFLLMAASVGGGAAKRAAEEVAFDDDKLEHPCEAATREGPLKSWNASNKLASALFLVGGGMALGKGEGGAGHFPREAAISNKFSAR